MVSAEDVILLIRRLSGAGIRVWLTGGWGIDALLGEQTRAHHDVDVVLLLDDMLRMREILAADGFSLKDYWSENCWVEDGKGNRTATAFVLQDPQGREFDAHAIRLDEQGNGLPAWVEVDGFIFKPADLAGRGTIAGVAVDCISPEMQMFCHQGYELPERQLRDLELLRERFFEK